MSLLHRRAISLILLVILAFAGALQAAPAFCCLADIEVVEAETSCCCPSETPEQQKQKESEEPCADKESCPKSCCHFSPNGTEFPPRVRAAAPYSTPVFASKHLDTPRYGLYQNQGLSRIDAQPPPAIYTISLHLWLQVLLR